MITPGPCPSWYRSWCVAAGQLPLNATLPQPWEREGVGMLLFPSDEWVDAWVHAANADPGFRESGRDWEGSVGVVLRDLPAQAGGGGHRYLRLAGRNGHWEDWALNSDEKTISGTLFVLTGGYGRWKQVIRGELNPLKAIVKGKIRVRGDLSEVLRWAKSILIL